MYKQILGTVFLINSILFLIIYIFFKSQIYFVVIAIVSLILLFLFKGKKLKEYFLVFIISIITIFYSYETYSTYILVNLKPFNDNVKKYDNRNKFEFYESLNKRIKNVSMVTPPSILKDSNENIFHFSGISNSKTINCNENGYYSVFDSDKYGFNNSHKRWNTNEIEFLLIGDSFTLGSCVNRPHDIASQLEKYNSSVLNLGYVATGPLSQYAILREFLSHKIKNVIWIYYEGNDLKDLNNELKNKILVKYLNDVEFTQDIKNKQKQINNLLKLKIENEKQLFIKKNSLTSKVINFLKLTNARVRISNIHQSKKKNNIPNPYDELKQILKLSNDLILSNNSKFYIVYLSHFENATKKNYSDTQYKNVKKIINELNIPFIDSYEKVFKNDSNPKSFFPFEKKGHFNENGYAKISEIIYNNVK